jgi:hypothetical protein
VTAGEELTSAVDAMQAGRTFVSGHPAGAPRNVEEFVRH